MSITNWRIGCLGFGERTCRELRARAAVLVRILVGDGDPDLSGLPDELRQAVLGLLERLGGGVKLTCT